MDARTVEQVESWEPREVAGGFRGLHDLADDNFSGAVRGGGAWLFMLNGRVVGIFDGSMDDFEDASGTAYEAPYPALPLLFAMQEQGGTTQAKYYTNDTSLSEADEMLSEASFTGYVELSENVMSGDYYVVYYGGRSMNVAFVGSRNQLKTGDEAFELADDEVGIYEVEKVDITVLDIPDVEDEEPVDEPVAGAAVTEPAERDEPATEDEPTATANEPAAETDDEAADVDPDTPVAEPTVDAEETAQDPSPADADPAATGTPDPDAPTAGADPSTDTTADPSPHDAIEQAEETTPDAEPGTVASERSAATHDPDSRRPDTDPETEPRTEPRGVDAAEKRSAPDRSEPVRTSTETGTPDPDATPADADEDVDDDDVFSEEERWRQAKSIPALSPDKTRERRRPDDERPEGAPERQQAAEARSAEPGRSAREQATEETRQPREVEGRQTDQAEPRQATREPSQPEPSRQSSEQVADLRAALEERAEQLARLEEELATARTERDDLQAERDELASKVERLQSRIQTLEGKLADAGSDVPDGPSGPELGVTEAMTGTNLFVRYDSRGKPTLESARDEGAAKDEVNANLRIEHHTQFDATGATVDGIPFDEFLENTVEYKFVRWVVSELLYEIRETGHESGLRDLFHAIAEIDRAQLRGAVEVETPDATERRQFDVVLRNRMGEPLVVAELNDSRDPVTGEMMTELVEASTDSAEGNEGLSAAFYVTRSFFEPDALESAADATGGGFLSRDKRESYVRIGRKQGYHLCLSEARSGSFHVNVPEL